MRQVERAYEAFCEERFPLPGKTQVASLETRLAIRLPEDYRQFLLDYNGGIFSEPDIIPPVEECPLDCLTFMNGIGATHPVAELATPSDLALFEGNVPLQVLPIGGTLMGNLLILITIGEYKGYIMLKVAFSYKYHLLATGINEFFALLQAPSDEDEE